MARNKKLHILTFVQWNAGLKHRNEHSSDDLFFFCLIPFSIVNHGEGNKTVFAVDNIIIALNYEYYLVVHIFLRVLKR